MTLTNTEVQKAKAAEKPFKLAAGKEKLMALGTYPDVGLAQARDKVDEARKLHAAGGDPMVVRRSDKIAAWVSAENSPSTPSPRSGMTVSAKAFLAKVTRAKAALAEPAG